MCSAADSKPRCLRCLPNMIGSFGKLIRYILTKIYLDKAFLLLDGKENSGGAYGGPLGRSLRCGPRSKVSVRLFPRTTAALNSPTPCIPISDTHSTQPTNE